MKFFSRICVFLVITLLYLSSCSIQKRLYSRGYYTEWNHEKKEIAEVGEQPSPQDIEVEAVLSETKPCLAQPAPAKEKAGPIPVLTHSITAQPREQDTAVKYSSCFSRPIVQAVNEGIKNKIFYPAPAGRIKPLAVTSFALTIISLVFLGCYLGGAITSIALILFAITGIAAIVTGIIALNSIKEQERGKGLAVISLTLFAILGLLLMAGI